MIPLMKNAFTNEYETKKALADFILKAPILSMHDMCFKFEEEFSAFQESHDAILFNSGGSANLAMFQTLKNLGLLKIGDKIGFSALTWSTNVMPIIQMGFEPVPIDVDINKLNVTSYTLEERLKEVDLKALFITNVLGFAGDLDKIQDICKNNNIIFLEDNCEALGTELYNKKTGSFGLMSSFSFFVAHHMSTIEGGMICTDNEDISDMLRIVRANGWDRNLKAKKQHELRKENGLKSEFLAKYLFYDLGYNLRPTEITGFLGVYQLQFLKDNVKIREKNYLELEKTAELNNDFEKIDHSHISKLSNFAYPVLCKSEKLKKRYLAQFSGAGIEIRPMIAGNIQKQPFYKKYCSSDYSLIGTDFIHNNGFYCGNYPELGRIGLKTIKSSLQKY
jgi:CDP-4-dehydro-6-deoxyglucose reductase, E1